MLFFFSGFSCRLCLSGLFCCGSLSLYGCRGLLCCGSSLFLSFGSVLSGLFCLAGAEFTASNLVGSIVLSSLGSLFVLLELALFKTFVDSFFALLCNSQIIS